MKAHEQSLVIAAKEAGSSLAHIIHSHGTYCKDQEYSKTLKQTLSQLHKCIAQFETVIHTAEVEAMGCE